MVCCLILEINKRGDEKPIGHIRSFILLQQSKCEQECYLFVIDGVLMIDNDVAQSAMLDYHSIIIQYSHTYKSLYKTSAYYYISGASNIYFE